MTAPRGNCDAWLGHGFDPGEIDHLPDGRGVYFDAPNGHLMEMITHPCGGPPEQI